MSPKGLQLYIVVYYMYYSFSVFATDWQSCIWSLAGILLWDSLPWSRRWAVLELVGAVWWRGPSEWPWWWQGPLLPAVEVMELNSGTGKAHVRMLLYGMTAYKCVAPVQVDSSLHIPSSDKFSSYSLSLTLSLPPSFPPFSLSFSVNLSLLVQLDVGSEVRLPATASLVWPSLVHTNSSSSVVEFPTTTIGNSSVRH